MKTFHSLVSEAFLGISESTEQLQEDVWKASELAKTDSSGGVAMRRILLSIYNCDWWEFSAGDLRSLDREHRTRALRLITSYAGGQLMHHSIERWIASGSDAFRVLADKQRHREISRFIECDGDGQCRWVRGGRERVVQRWGDEQARQYEADF